MSEAIQVRAKSDAWNDYFLKFHNVPAGWRWVNVSCRPDVAPDGFARVVGAVCPSRKDGGPNWKKRVKETERTFFIQMKELREYEKQQKYAGGGE